MHPERKRVSDKDQLHRANLAPTSGMVGVAFQRPEWTVGDGAQLPNVEGMTIAALLVAARSYVVELAGSTSPASLRDIKQLVYRHAGIGYADAWHEADAFQWRSLDRDDAIEGVHPLVEQRPPRFQRLGAGSAE
jgi:enoyl-CoA hydratase/carnithine racemase